MRRARCPILLAFLAAAACQQDPPSEPPDAGAGGTGEQISLFVDDRVAEVRVELAAADWAAMLADPEAEAWYPGAVSYDDTRIEQVMVNLMLNACQALPDPGRSIRVFTSRESDRDGVLFVVEDECVGIPSEDLSRLTDPFFTTKRERGGTGLGLSVSAGIVKEHGGSLEFRSVPGAGTTAILSLPAIPAEADR